MFWFVLGFVCVLVFFVVVFDFFFSCWFGLVFSLFDCGFLFVLALFFFSLIGAMLYSQHYLLMELKILES